MGSIRNVLYGYSIEKGVIVLNREEAPIVFEAFNRYCVGEILKDIADSFTERGIAYYRDKTAWTKNIICRMIENRNYVGNDKYPPIISDEIYTIDCGCAYGKHGALACIRLDDMKVFYSE